MDQYKEYLATNVLNEGRPINYRLLSRALDVHVNLAKQMLYDFHKTQNAKKFGSVHATYLVSGSKRSPAIQANGTNGVGQDGEIPSSSPYQSSLPDADDEPARTTIKETLIMLAREEDFEDAKSRYEEITALHIYSLEPGPLKSLNLLSDCNREVYEKLASVDDPVEALRSYGVIYNPHVKRRTGRQKQTTRPTPAANKTAPRPSIATKAKAEPEKESKATQPKQKESNSQADAPAGPGKKESKLPSTKRETSNLFSSFSKAKPKKTPTAEAAPTPPADEPMLSESEGEEAEDVVSTKKSVPKDSGEIQKAKAEADLEKEQRDKALRDMMDEPDDEEMEDAPASAEEEPEDVPIDKPKLEEKQEDTVTVTGGRRRGKRRVMKKKTVKDEEGFLVTKEEAVWESFSEDEPAPKKPRLPSATSKGKKGGAKQGQGSIMSFFSKK
ncbi:DNA polymerase subunit Cdc27 [Phyllosticta citriasiana]|uniref:DNA polymerase subunit Cdc27 n=1 Tax=Phyllosticta citriasiana TaxID=595635 RepID=UPI0030FDE7C9